MRCVVLVHNASRGRDGSRGLAGGADRAVYESKRVCLRGRYREDQLDDELLDLDIDGNDDVRPKPETPNPNPHAPSHPLAYLAAHMQRRVGISSDAMARWSRRKGKRCR